MLLHCSIHYKEEILYEQSDITNPHYLYWQKHQLHYFLPCSQHEK